MRIPIPSMATINMGKRKRPAADVVPNAEPSPMEILLESITDLARHQREFLASMQRVERALDRIAEQLDSATQARAESGAAPTIDERDAVCPAKRISERALLEEIQHDLRAALETTTTAER